MILLIGLGNPGLQYVKTVHNVGFEFIDFLADCYRVSSFQNKFNSLYAIVSIANFRVVLIRPMSYMNLSGDCVGSFMRFYNAAIRDIIVVHDDIYINPGVIQLSLGGSGGHNGIKSINNRVGEGYRRIRIGMGRNLQMPIERYVLSKQGDDLQKVNYNLFGTMNEYIDLLLQNKSDLFMSRVSSGNIKKSP